MKSTTRTGVLVYMCLVLVGLCGWQQMKIRELQRMCLSCAAIASEKSCQVAIGKEKPTARLCGAEKSNMAKVFVSDAENERPAPANAVTPAPDAKPADFMKSLAGMMDSPEMKEAIRLQQKSSMEMMYGGLFSYLDLSDENRSKLQEMLLDKQMALMEHSIQGMNTSLSPEERSVQMAKIKKVKQEYDEQIKAFLGDEDYAIFDEYEQTQPERMQMQQFKQALPADNALTPEQEHELILAMNGARTNFTYSVNMEQMESDPSLLTEASVELLVNDFSALNQRYQTLAAELLSEEQQKVYSAFLEQQLAMQRAGMKMAVQMFRQSE